MAGASFDSLQRIYHDHSAEREAENVPVDKLPEEYAKLHRRGRLGCRAFRSFPFPGPADGSSSSSLQVTGRRPEGDIRYEDVKDRIRQQLGQELAIRRYIDRLRQGTYVEVRS